MFFVALQSVLATVFLAAGVGKLLEPAATRQMLGDLGLKHQVLGAVTLTLALSEITTALLLVPEITIVTGSVVALMLLATFTSVMSVSLARGHRLRCSCFGGLDAQPIGRRTLARNLLLIGVAVALFLRHSVSSSSADTAGLEIGSNASLVLLFVVVGTAVWLVLSLQLRQHALRAKIQELEHRSAVRDPAVATGLPVGSRAPRFETRLLSGGVSSLTDFLSRGKPLLLMFVSPSCAACHALLPLLVAWQQQYASVFTLVAISEGPVEVNRREFGRLVPDSVLIQHNATISKAYRAQVIPSGLLISANGEIASPLADTRSILSIVLEFTLGRH